MIKKTKTKAVTRAKHCLKFASDKMAINPIILQVKDLTDVADYFVICGGTSTVHIKTIADYIVEKMDKDGIKPFHFEADSKDSWIVIDFSDVIVHIFNEETRNNYRLEHLWGDAKRV